jgi:hypothetical protein
MTPLTKSRNTTGSVSIGIKRSGSSVQISLQCDNEYQAMEAYDRLVAGAEKGQVKIELKPVPNTH